MFDFDFCITRNETARPRYFQYRIRMFCLPISTFIYTVLVSFSDFCIPGWVCLFFGSQIGRPILGIYKLLTDTELRTGRTVSFLGIYKSDFRNSVLQNVRTFLKANKPIEREKQRFSWTKSRIFHAEYDMAILFTLFILKVIQGV
jgi:hypothetical protein